jgi:hypothetical protein
MKRNSAHVLRWIAGNKVAAHLGKFELSAPEERPS